MSPRCTNCGGHVSADFMRVFAPDDITNPDQCLNCPGQANIGFEDVIKEGRI